MNALYRSVLKEAQQDPTTDEGFSKWVAAFAASLLLAASPHDRIAAHRATALLSHIADGSRGIDAVLRDVSSVLSVASSAVSRAIRGPLRRYVRSIVAATRRFSVGRYGLPNTPELWTTRILDFVRRSPVAWVRNEYGRRDYVLGVRVRQTIATGVEAGWSAKQIAQQLRFDAETAVLSRGRAYWEVVATNAAARARSLTQLAAMHLAGIRNYMFVAVMDARTSDICRFMHGRVFTVGDALSNFRRLERAGPEDPAAALRISPFVRTLRRPDGTLVMYVGVGRRRKDIADVLRSGVGQPGEVGLYVPRMDERELRAAGVLYPPLHHRCRSDVIPVS